LRQASVVSEPGVESLFDALQLDDAANGLLALPKDNPYFAEVGAGI
jgi:hypothetical protein